MLICVACVCLCDYVCFCASTVLFHIFMPSAENLDALGAKPPPFLQPKLCSLLPSLVSSKRHAHTPHKDTRFQISVSRLSCVHTMQPSLGALNPLPSAPQQQLGSTEKAATGTASQQQQTHPTQQAAQATPNPHLHLPPDSPWVMEGSCKKKRKNTQHVVQVWSIARRSLADITPLCQAAHGHACNCICTLLHLQAGGLETDGVTWL